MRKPKSLVQISFVPILILALILTVAGGSLSQEIGAAQEQDFVDAKNALESAREAQAEKYAPKPLKKAEELLAAVNEARLQKDPIKFSQTSRLARAYAELARATAELKAEEEKLALIQEELQKARSELDRLKKSFP